MHLEMFLEFLFISISMQSLTGNKVIVLLYPFLHPKRNNKRILIRIHSLFTFIGIVKIKEGLSNLNIVIG